MRNKLFIFLLLMSGLVSASFAQEQSPTPKGPKIISGGVLNGKATSLAKPSYPRVARDEKADGAVNVQVTVDEEGSVISAVAVSGHPLLRGACEQAALASKFAPTRLNGQPVKVTGVIVYNFVLPMSFMQIGYELSLAQKSPTPEIFPLASLGGTLPRSWQKEKDALYDLEEHSIENLAEQEKREPEKREPEKTVTDEPPVAASDVVGLASNQLRTVSSGARYGFSLSSKSPKAVEILKDVQEKLADRLSDDEKNLWYFQTGRILGSIVADRENAEKTRNDLSKLKEMIDDAPPGINEALVKKIGEITQYSEFSALDAERRDELTTLVKNLRYIRVE